MTSPDEHAIVRGAELALLAHLLETPGDVTLVRHMLPASLLVTPWLRRMYAAALRGVQPSFWLARHLAAPAPVDGPAPRHSSALRVLQPSRLRFAIMVTAAQAAELRGYPTGRALALDAARWLAAGAVERRRRWASEARLARLQTAVAARALAGLPLGDLARAYDAALAELR